MFVVLKRLLCYTAEVMAFDERQRYLHSADKPSGCYEFVTSHPLETRFVYYYTILCCHVAINDVILKVVCHFKINLVPPFEFRS